MRMEDPPFEDKGSRKAAKTQRINSFLVAFGGLARDDFADDAAMKTTRITYEMPTKNPRRVSDAGGNLSYVNPGQGSGRPGADAGSRIFKKQGGYSKKRDLFRASRPLSYPPLLVLGSPRGLLFSTSPGF